MIRTSLNMRSVRDLFNNKHTIDWLYLVHSYLFGLIS